IENRFVTMISTTAIVEREMGPGWSIAIPEEARLQMTADQEEAASLFQQLPESLRRQWAEFGPDTVINLPDTDEREFIPDNEEAFPPLFDQSRSGVPLRELDVEPSTALGTVFLEPGAINEAVERMKAHRFTPRQKVRRDKNGEIVTERQPSEVAGMGIGRWGDLGHLNAVYEDGEEFKVFGEACRNSLELRMRQEGAKFVRELGLRYRVPGHFSFYYNICPGQPTPIPEDIWENQDFLYGMPDGTAVPIRSCREYTESCAPTLIQMMAADFMFARRQLTAAGFKTPTGTYDVGITKGDIPIFVTMQVDRSAALLARIWMNSAWAYTRYLALHEYFHLVQEAYASNRALALLRTDDWRAPQVPGFKESFFWSHKESGADWAASVLVDRYPPYPEQLSFDNSYGYPFEQAYHALPFGYVMEQATKDRKPRLCYGCDAMKEYLEMLESSLWSSSSWAQFLDRHQLLDPRTKDTETLIENYHRDLMLSLFKKGPRAPKHRFKATKTVREADWDFPTAMQTLPDNAPSWIKCGDKVNGTAKPFQRGNAGFYQRGNRTRLQDIECTYTITSAGAAIFRVPLKAGDMPTRLVVSANAVTTDAQSNGRRQTVGPIKIIGATAANRGNGARDIRQLDGLEYFAEDRSQTFVFDQKLQNDGVTDAFLVVRNPSYHAYNVTSRGAPPFEGMIDVTLSMKAYYD
ncbi:MAG: hypothetical protein HRU11_09705, partial [Parvularculaceae bacterium]|nr:hypothetical protein [Parvularculaceae bacterium]